MGEGRAKRIAGALGAVLCAALATLAKGPAGMAVFLVAILPGFGFGLLFADRHGSRRLARFGLALAIAAGCVAAGTLSLWLWSQAVADRIETAAVQQAILTESGENLRLFTLSAWSKNLETLSYGAGLGSPLAIMAVGRLLLRKPPRRGASTPGLWIVVLWFVGSFALFSLTTKGVGRYLTPIWPALGLLSAWWLVDRLGELEGAPRRALQRAMVALLVSFGIGQALWSGIGRGHFAADQTPRRFVQELRAALAGDAEVQLAAGHVGSYDLWSSALDLELGFGVTPWAGPANTADTPHITPAPIERLAEALRSSKDGECYLLFLRIGPAPGHGALGLAIDQIRALGLEVRPISTRAAWRVDNHRTEVQAVILRAPAG